MAGRKARREPAVAAGPAPASKDEGSRSSRPTSARRRKRGAAGGRALRRLFYWSLVLGLWAVIGAIGAVAFVVSTLPPIQSLEVPKRPPTVEIVGIDGRPLVLRGEMSGTDVPIKELPAYLPKAFIAIEDRRFYGHFGADPIGLARALVANVLRRGVSQGGSTLTQQLAKNLFLSGERSLLRKGQEAILTAMLEAAMDKRRIFEIYLNVAEWGENVFGAEAAARHYFGVDAAALEPEQAARLAAMLPRPRYYDRNRDSGYLESYSESILEQMPAAQIP